MQSRLGVTESLSDKIFLGSNVGELETGDMPANITRVNLSVDSDHYYTAGDDTGRAIEVTCPWGSQEMANSILSSVSGKTYQPYTATDALLDPAAEIGDAVTIGGYYSVIADISTSFDRACAPTISAPESDEIDDEYPYESREKRETDRQLAQTRSLISKTAKEIRLEVSNKLDGLSASIDIKLDSITQQITGINGELTQITADISGITQQVQDVEGNISTLQQTATSLQSQITSINGDVSSLEQTATSLQSQITSANGDISTLQQYSNQLSSIITNVSGDVSTLEQKVDSITLSVSNAYSSSTIELLVNGISVASEQIRFTGTVVFEDDLADGTTTVSGDCITTGEVSARYIRLGGQMDVYESLRSSADVGGYIGYMTGMTAAGSSTSGIAICSYDESALVICTNAGVRMGYDGVSTVVCTSTQVSIRGDAVYINGEPQSASDARLKTQVQEDLDRYLPVFDKLRPVTFVYDGHKRRHMGFIAQEIQQTLADEGIPESDFAALCTEVPNEERPMGMYSLRYGELQIMTVAKVQELDRRLKLLEAQYGQG